jgi:hypothetical protein
MMSKQPCCPTTRWRKEAQAQGGARAKERQRREAKTQTGGSTLRGANESVGVDHPRLRLVPGTETRPPAAPQKEPTEHDELQLGQTSASKLEETNQAHRSATSAQKRTKRSDESKKNGRAQGPHPPRSASAKGAKEQKKRKRKKAQPKGATTMEQSAGLQSDTHWRGGARKRGDRARRRQTALTNATRRAL